MTTAAVEPILRFIEYARTLKGDEKGEAQVFCDRLFQAFGHGGYKEAGATLEFRVKGAKSTKFADLLWRPRLLMEMKKRGEKLQKHYTQAFEYWLQLVPQRPKYVVLCNFDEFWIYDFDSQLNDPVDVVALDELPQRYTAFNFLFPVEKKPQFGNNRVDVTRAAAANVAGVFNALVARGEDREQAQRFALQCVVAMFSEDAELLPRGLFSELLDECKRGESTYDLVGGLFRQMNSQSPAKGGRFKGVRYFNGGIFQTVNPLELVPEEVDLLLKAAEENWSKVQPPIFGTLFQSSMGKERRHAFGAHFTSEADIQKVVLPTIVRPWRERIEAAKTLKELRALLEELRSFRVLDPACGSGNFLYVAFRELKRLELSLMAKIHAEFGRKAQQSVGTRSLVSIKQFFGIDKEEFAVELAKVTLMIAKELAIDESQAWIDSEQLDLPIEFDAALPLDNLDDNIKANDALFCEWPEADAIVGNPPFQSKNKMQGEYGPAYLNRLRDAYPCVPGRADYCVYWFRRAHDELPAGGHAGLVGTNTIRQNYSREGGLDYIVGNGGTITEAVSTQVWSGDAVVHVSIANWVKGDAPGKKKLFTQLGDLRESPWEVVELDEISPALSASFDVTQAQRLRANIDSGACYQGQTHGHEGFLLSPAEAAGLLQASAENAEVLLPYLTGDDLLSHQPPAPQRYVIDLQPRDILTAGQYPKLIERLKATVLPAREAAAEEEAKRNKRALDANPKAKVNQHHRNFLNKWWLLSYPRPELISKIAAMPRYIACARVTKRPIFEFVDKGIRPSDALQLFPLPDDYSFGILQSGIHWSWFIARCSTLKGDFRYTSDTVFDTFPWPQEPTIPQVKKVAEAAVALRQLRRNVMAENQWSLRQLYRTLDTPGQNPLRAAQQALDAAVRSAYGMKAKGDPLAFLLALNGELADKEVSMKPVAGPGLPTSVKDVAPFITADCIKGGRESRYGR
ncbi:class I SAM-dependent DNA methyltransferase [Tautonia sociabilis]|uniref:site-specific DNA-methyltransferase (adenine-specific) n=1 Tax=Tautonia sociabilis TaxID=2080755 RepID=A0A432MPR9_9BACT|nr:class I SAM-dependent DNA methyltransferase [Tautonia sociabilis]RUL89461.1 class I SAM-dependent DNA methyltransferase [Tautonia sociabilis]